MAKLLCIFILAILLGSPLILADKGVGLFWDKTEIQGFVGDKICVSYGLYNPFSQDINAFLDVEGNITQILENPLKDLKIKESELKQKVDVLTDKYRNEQTIEIAENLNSVKEQLNKVEDSLLKINKDKSILIKAGIPSNERINQEICFKPLKNGIYNGEVIARYITESNGVMGSATQAGVSANLRIVALKKDSIFPYYWVAGIIFLFIGAFILFKIRHRKKMIIVPILFFICISVYYVNAISTVPSSASVNSYPLLTIISPLNQTYTSQIILFNLTSNINISLCRFSLDNFLNNYTMTKLSPKLFNYTNSSMPLGSYTAKFWCNSTTNLINNSESISFAIVISGGEGGGGGGGGSGGGNLKPERVELIYDKEWKQNSESTIKVDVFDYSNKTYLTNITINSSSLEISLKKYYTLGNSSYLVFKIEKPQIKEQFIDVTASDERKVTERAIFSIIKEDLIPQGLFQDEQIKKYGLIISLILIILMILIILIIAFLYDRTEKRGSVKY